MGPKTVSQINSNHRKLLFKTDMQQDTNLKIIQNESLSLSNQENQFEWLRNLRQKKLISKF